MGYASRTGTRRNLRALATAGWRLLISAAGVWRTEGMAYALDNGAWSAFQQGQPFDESAFVGLVDALGAGADWLVVPDVVCGGMESLEYSLSWLSRLRGVAPLLLAVQDGMTAADIEPHVAADVGVFVGGSTEWKEATLPIWVDVRENARSSAVYRGRPVDFPDTPRRPCSSAGGADLKSNLADLAGDLGEALGDVAATKRAILAWENAARDRWAACAWFLGETRALLALAGHVGNDSEFGSRVALLGADVVRVSDGEADLSILPVEGDHRG